MTDKISDEEAQQAAMQEPMLNKLHEDPRIEKYLYLGLSPETIRNNDALFTQRAIWLTIATDQAVEGVDLKGVFNSMSKCLPNHPEIAEEALEAIEEFARKYKRGEFKPANMN